jgi:hypothetical protein
MANRPRITQNSQTTNPIRGIGPSEVALEAIRQKVESANGTTDANQTRRLARGRQGGGRPGQTLPSEPRTSGATAGPASSPL